jgi:hypothetical protein
MKRAFCGMALLGLLGCAPLRTETPCSAPSQQPMVVTEMFFGRDIPGRQPLTDREWSDFATAAIAREFPNGFTVTDGEGQWQNPQTRVVAHERAIVLLAASVHMDGLAGRISRISDAYRTKFHQASVGVLTYNACGAF